MDITTGSHEDIHPDLLSIEYCIGNVTDDMGHWHLPGAVSMVTPVAMFLAGLVGNTLALVVLYRTKKEPRFFTFYTLVAGLTWTDLAGQILTTPITVITYLNDLNWVGGRDLCRYSGFIMVCFGLATPIIVSVMAVERFLSLKYPYFFLKRCHKINARWTLIFVWSIVVFYGLLPFLGFGDYSLQYPGTWCFTSFHTNVAVNNAYSAMYASINITLIFAMTLFNIYVVVTLLRVRHLLRTASGHFVTPSDSRVGTLVDPLNVQYDRAQRCRGSAQKTDEWQMALLLCVMTIAFVVCWLPLMVTILVTIVTGLQCCALNLLAVRMASINQIVDPWFYIIIRKSLVRRVISFWKYIVSWSDHSNQRLAAPRYAPQYIVQNKNIYVDAVKACEASAPGTENRCTKFKGSDHNHDGSGSRIESRNRVQPQDVRDMLRGRPSSSMRLFENRLDDDENRSQHSVDGASNSESNDYVVIVASNSGPTSSGYYDFEEPSNSSSGDTDPGRNMPLRHSDEKKLSQTDSDKGRPTITISKDIDGDDNMHSAVSVFDNDDCDKLLIINEDEQCTSRSECDNSPLYGRIKNRSASLKVPTTRDTEIRKEPMSCHEIEATHVKDIASVKENKPKIIKHRGRFRWSSKSKSRGESDVDGVSKVDSNVFTETSGFCTGDSDRKPTRQKYRSCEQCPVNSPVSPPDVRYDLQCDQT